MRGNMGVSGRTARWARCQAAHQASRAPVHELANLSRRSAATAFSRAAGSARLAIAEVRRPGRAGVRAAGCGWREAEAEVGGTGGGVACGIGAGADGEDLEAANAASPAKSKAGLPPGYPTPVFGRFFAGISNINQLSPPRSCLQRGRQPNPRRQPRLSAKHQAARGCQPYEMNVNELSH